MAEWYFPREARMQATLGSSEGKAAVGDFSNFATGGVTVVIGAVER
jgi:hypothetical protein